MLPLGLWTADENHPVIFNDIPGKMKVVIISQIGGHNIRRTKISLVPKITIIFVHVLTLVENTQPSLHASWVLSSASETQSLKVLKIRSRITAKLLHGKLWKIEILKGKPVPIQSGEETVKCDLLTLLKYGINISEKKLRLFSNHIIESTIGRFSD